MNRLLRTAGIAIFAPVFIPLVAAAQATAGNAAGQSAADRGEEPICVIGMGDSDGRIVDHNETLPNGGILTANCEGQGYMLGQADGFMAMPHRESGAVAVVVGRENGSKVWLFLRGEDGRIMAEDLSFEFARAVGRSATSDLADVRINLARFRESGVIGAEPMSEDPADADGTRGTSRAAMAPGRQGTRPARAAEIALEQRLLRGRPAAGSGTAPAGGTQ